MKIFQKYVENHTSPHADSTFGWIILAILYCMYLADFIVTVAVIRGLNKKLTRLNKIRSDMRIVSDKISDTVANTSIDTAQVIEEGKVQTALAKAEIREAVETKKDQSIEKLLEKRTELQREFDELSNSITNHTIVGQGRIIKAFPAMKHRYYHELIQELRKNYKERL